MVCKAVLYTMCGPKARRCRSACCTVGSLAATPLLSNAAFTYENLRLLRDNERNNLQLKAIDKSVRDIVADSAEFAQTDPEPDPSELYTDIIL